MELRDQRVLVTGVSRGIGRALVPTLLDAGARVAGCARNAAGLETLADELGVEPSRLHLQPCDMGDPDAVAALVGDVERVFGGIDILVNNAAVLPKPATIEETDPAVWSHTLQINVVGPMAAARAVLPGMRARGHGAIVNLSSGWGRRAVARVAPYCASKFAIEAFSSALAQEVPDEIVVVALNPGSIATDMLADAFESDVSGYRSPASLAPNWLQLFRELGPAVSGRSLDLS